MKQHVEPVFLSLDFLSDKFDWRVFTKLSDKTAKPSTLTSESTNQTESCSGSSSSSTTHPGQQEESPQRKNC